MPNRSQAIAVSWTVNHGDRVSFNASQTTLVANRDLEILPKDPFYSPFATGSSSQSLLARSSSDSGPPRTNDAQTYHGFKSRAVGLLFTVRVRKPSVEDPPYTYLIECRANGQIARTEERVVYGTDPDDDGYVLIPWAGLPIYMYGVGLRTPIDINLVRVLYSSEPRERKRELYGLACWRLNSKTLSNSKSKLFVRPDSKVHLYYEDIEPVSTHILGTGSEIKSLEYTLCPRSQVQRRARLFKAIHEAMLRTPIWIPRDFKWEEDHISPYEVLKPALSSGRTWGNVFLPDPNQPPPNPMTVDTELYKEFADLMDAIARCSKKPDLTLDVLRLLRRLNRMRLQESILPARMYLNLTELGMQECPRLNNVSLPRGSYGEVCKVMFAVDGFKRYYAHKKPRVTSAEDNCVDVVMKFCREALLWSYLRHPHILEFYGVGSWNPPPTTWDIALISPWMDNGTILAYLKHRRNEEVNRVKLITEVVCGLQYLHALEFYHGDIRGMNILVNNGEHACLTDFGISSVIRPEELEQSTMLDNGNSKWSAPELFEGSERTKACDVYSLAKAMWEIFTLFDMPSRDIELHRHGHAASTKYADTKARGLSDEIWDMMWLSWEKDPGSRPKLAKWAQCLRGELHKMGYRDLDSRLQEDFGW